ncbi:hypothetical protein FRB91_010785 [Serendipita sp. 411]|nr:hypothetical protein FRB91_010785 [Serendipita sp. 411]
MVSWNSLLVTCLAVAGVYADVVKATQLSLAPLAVQVLVLLRPAPRAVAALSTGHNAVVKDLLGLHAARAAGHAHTQIHGSLIACYPLQQPPRLQAVVHLRPVARAAA